MAVIEIARIQVRRGQEGTTGMPQLEAGEFGWAEDTQHLYIGKRIAEGANSDENSRILTEFDLRNISDLLSSASTATINTLYQYRAGVSYVNTASGVRTLQNKQDDIVNLADFKVIPSSTATDISTYLKAAVQTLFNNNTNVADTRRTLRIPAGNYIITKAIDLPPYTTLVGEGMGITTLILSSTNTNMFRTVDGLGTAFDGGMRTGSTSSRNILISNMTLAYAAGNVNDNALLSLDNTENPILEKIRFTTVGTSLSSSTFYSTGTAVALRGSIGSDESSFICKNIIIKNCHFDSMRLGIYGYGSVSRPIIDNNLMSNLGKGIYFTASSTSDIPPLNMIASKNKFRFILNQAIHVTTNTNRTNHISSENTFHYVGNNGSMPDETITTTSTSIMTFETDGNVSNNDSFSRRESADINPNFYYNPFVSGGGTTKINSSLPRYKIISSGTADQSVIKIPLTRYDQAGYIDYQLVNSSVSRKGQLLLNISADGYASVSDYYNYSEIITDSAKNLIFSTDLSKSDATTSTYKNYVTITCSNLSTASTYLEYNVNLMV
jgi:hypothetical protein